jgi:hypothetical protein
VGCGADAASDAGTATTAAPGTAVSATTGGTTLTAHQKAVKFSECIRAHGVSDFPDPDAKNDYQYGVSVSPEVWTKAVNACKALQPPGTLSSKRTPEQQSESLQFARCIRAHGVKDFPDPVNGQPLVDTTKIPSSNAPGGMTILNAAMQKCKSIMVKVLKDR